MYAWALFLIGASLYAGSWMMAAIMYWGASTRVARLPFQNFSNPALNPMHSDQAGSRVALRGARCLFGLARSASSIQVALENPDPE